MDSDNIIHIMSAVEYYYNSNEMHRVILIKRHSHLDMLDCNTGYINQIQINQLASKSY